MLSVGNTFGMLSGCLQLRMLLGCFGDALGYFVDALGRLSGADALEMPGWTAVEMLST